MLVQPPVEPPKSSAPSSDHALLTAYIVRRDEQAFAAILERHGPLVMGVCRRVLRSEQDAQDAFQATFLVLAMKAKSVRPQFLGTWLYSVATRTSLRLRAQDRRRAAQERRFMRLSGFRSTSTDRNIADEIFIDEQIQRLPRKYQAVVVRCLAQGMSKSEAAAELGWPEGTVSSRLNQARQLLRRRLERAGFGASAMIAIGSVGANLTRGDVPAQLLAATAKAATAAGATAEMAGMISTQVLPLAGGVKKAMWVAKIKIITAALLAPTLVLAATVLAVQMRQAASTQPATPAVPLSPAVDTLIAQLDEQASHLKNLIVMSESWEEISTEHGVGEWKRGTAYTSVSAWYEGLPSPAARVDYHRQVQPWIQGAAPYYERSYTLATDGKTSTQINHSEGIPGQLRLQNHATRLGPLTAKDFSGAGYATGTMYSIYRDPKLSDFLGRYLREVLQKQPGIPMTVTREDHEGVQAIRLSVGSEDKVMEAWWFDPARGMAQLGYRHSGVTPGGRKMISVEARVTKLGEIAPKLWYPLEAFRYWNWYPEADDHFAGPARTLEEARKREHYVAKKAVANSTNFDPAVFSPPIPQGYTVTDRSHAPGPTTFMGTR